LPPVVLLVIVSSGCGETGNPGIVPEPKYAGATRDGIDNPAGVKKTLSARAKAAAAKAAQYDPRLAK